MKLWTRAIAFVAAAAIFALVLSAHAESVVNSPHNMNNFTGVALPDAQVCLPCHTPHAVPTDPVTGNQLGKLWNHTMSTNTSYTLYKPATSDPAKDSYLAARTAPGGMDETSRKCLSCHDGTTAVDSYGGTTGTHKIGGTSASVGFRIGGPLGNDLTHDHPIGVTYPTVDATSGLWTSTSFKNPTSFSTATYVDGTGAAQLPTRALSLASIGSYKVVGCGTCHTPHDHVYGFLRISNTRSQLCLTCHIK